MTREHAGNLRLWWGWGLLTSRGMRARERGQVLSSQWQRAGPQVSGCHAESHDSPSSLHLNMHELINPSRKRPLRAGHCCSGAVLALGFKRQGQAWGWA